MLVTGGSWRGEAWGCGTGKTCLQIESRLPSSGSKIKTCFAFSKKQVSLLHRASLLGLLRCTLSGRKQSTGSTSPGAATYRAATAVTAACC